MIAPATQASVEDSVVPKLFANINANTATLATTAIG